MVSWKFFAFSKDDVTAGYNNFSEDKKMNFCLSIEDWPRTKFKVNLGPDVGDITISMTRQGGAGSAPMAGYIRSLVNIQDDSLLNLIEGPKAWGRLMARYCKPPYVRKDL